MISIIIPVYNVELYLKQCLESVINQSYRDIEILLIDDGSTDKSRVICEEYARKDSRIHVYYKQHEGPAEVRNFGLKKAKGDYIGFVDSDDYIDLNMYQSLYELCKKYDADISIINYAAFTDEVIRHQDMSNKESVFDKEKILKLFIEENSEYMITPAIWSKLFKKEIVSELEFPKGKVCAEDFWFVTQAFIRAGRIAYLNKELYYYRQRPGSIMTNTELMEKRIMDEIELYEKRVELLKELGSKDLTDSGECALYKRMILRYGELIERKVENSECAQSLRRQICDYRKNVNIKKCIKTEKKQNWVKAIIMYGYPEIYFEVLKKLRINKKR